MSNGRGAAMRCNYCKSENLTIIGGAFAPGASNVNCDNCKREGVWPIGGLSYRLQGRAETSRGNARSYRSQGYQAEALLHEARASAYELAAKDAEQFEREGGS